MLTEFRRLPPAEYFGDPCPTPSLNPSIANTLVLKSAAHARLEHPRLGGKARASTKAQDRGTIMHGMLLGTGAPLHIVDAFDWKGKAAQGERAEAYLAGEVPVLVDEHAELELVAGILRDKLAARGITFTGQSEIAAFWVEQSAIGPVQCRGQLDHLFIVERPLAATIYDLKCWRSAHPDDVESDVDDRGAAVQAVAYTRAVEAIRPDLVGRVDYKWIFAELEEPHCVTVAEPDGQLRTMGETIWSSAVARWADCLKRDRWPEYVEGVARIGAKPWTFKRVMGSDW